jgi:predicted TIM-barrel fold metal-dependent hydrolase
LRRSAGAGFAHGVVVNLFSADLFRQQLESALPPDAGAAERARVLAEFDATISERYVALNRWLMDTLADVPTISGFVAMDPWALSSEGNVEHLREMAERGARGVKLHPVVQKFEANDPRMYPGVPGMHRDGTKRPPVQIRPPRRPGLSCYVQFQGGSL